MKTYKITESDYLRLVSLARLGAIKSNNPPESHKDIEKIHVKIGFKSEQSKVTLKSGMEWGSRK